MLYNHSNWKCTLKNLCLLLCSLCLEMAYRLIPVLHGYHRCQILSTTDSFTCENRVVWVWPRKQTVSNGLFVGNLDGHTQNAVQNATSGPTVLVDHPTVWYVAEHLYVIYFTFVFRKITSKHPIMMTKLHMFEISKLISGNMPTSH